MTNFDPKRQPILRWDSDFGTKEFTEWVSAQMEFHTALAFDRAFWHGEEARLKTCLVRDCPCVGGPWPKGQIKGVLNGL